MRTLEEINDVKTLQQVASHLEKSTIRLAKENAKLKAENTRLKYGDADPQLELDLLGGLAIALVAIALVALATGPSEVALGEVIERANAARGNHGHGHGVRDRPGELEQGRLRGALHGAAQRDQDGQRRQVTTPPVAYRGDYQPRLSPDGKSLAFLSNREGAWAVYVLRVASGDVQKVIATGDNYPDPVSERLPWGALKSRYFSDAGN